MKSRKVHHMKKSKPKKALRGAWSDIVKRAELPGPATSLLLPDAPCPTCSGVCPDCGGTGQSARVVHIVGLVAAPPPHPRGDSPGLIPAAYTICGGHQPSARLSFVRLTDSPPNGGAAYRDSWYELRGLRAALERVELACAQDLCKQTSACPTCVHHANSRVAKLTASLKIDPKRPSAAIGATDPVLQGELEDPRQVRAREARS